ncbi:MAG: hypothetical protein NT079_04105 [Candidatus Omnitrophica bacterium]|nr:hypothetical protein [Candidatus Omnitrophota bacterium]
MKFKNRKGQSTIEYVLLVTAVIAVMIVFLRPSSQGKLYNTMEASYNDVANGITTVTGNLTSTWGQ